MAKDYIYVMSPSGEFYAMEETEMSQLEFYHFSLLAGVKPNGVRLQ